MNELRVKAALATLARAACDLGQACDREAIEFARVWHGISRNAEALRSDLSAEDLKSLLRSVAMLFSDHPGAFTEDYIKRADPDEQLAENVRFNELKERVMAAAGEAGAAAREGEVNTGAIRRHLTSLETVMLEANRGAEAEALRSLLRADELDCSAARALAEDLAQRNWTDDTAARVRMIVNELRRELAPTASVDGEGTAH